MGGQGRRMEDEPHTTATAVATPERVTIAGGPQARERESYKDVAMHGTAKKRFAPPFPRGRHGDVAVSGAAFWSLLAGVLALAVAAQYAVMVAGGARGAAHYAHDAWLAARSSAAHAGHTAAAVMHGGPHWAWTSADTGHPAETLRRRARAGLLRARAWPWNWLRAAEAHYADAPHGAADTLFTRLFWRRRAECAPPLKYGNWARVAASHARYGACETAAWAKAHLMPWSARGHATRFF